MSEQEEILSIIGNIYDAALDPGLWRSALGGVTSFAGGHATGIYAKDVVARTGEIFFDDGAIAADYTSLYFTRYVKMDPSSVGHFFTDVGAIASTDDFISYDEFVETRIYREWVRPQGLVDHAAAVLEKSSTKVSLFGVFRHERQGKVDEEMRRRMLLLVPHVRRALLIAGRSSGSV